MDEESTAKLRGLLKNSSGSASPTSFIQSGRLRNSLRSARNWVMTLFVLGICSIGLIVLLILMEILFAPENDSFLRWIGLLILLVPLLLPLSFMGMYALRLHEFLKHGQPERFVSMLVAQRWMWTVLGIYAGLLMLLTGLMMILLLGTLMPFGF